MPNPRIAEAGKATRFKKGNVPVSPGRPKKTAVSDAYAKHIGSGLPDDLRLKLRLPKGSTWADAVALGQLRSAVKGRTDAAREIADRTEGRVGQPVEVSGPDGGAMLVEALQAGRERVRAWREKHPRKSDSEP